MSMGVKKAKTFFKKTFRGSGSRPKYCVEVMDGLMVGCFHFRYFEEDLRKLFEKRAKDGTRLKVLLVDAGPKPWMTDLLSGEVEFEIETLGPFHCVPSLSSLFEVVADMVSWVQAGIGSPDKHIVLVVASRYELEPESKPLVPLSLLLSCYLDYMDLYDDHVKSMDFVRKRIGETDLAGREVFKTSAGIMNSLGYLDNFHYICADRQVHKAMPFVLKSIRVNGGVNLTSLQRWNPIVQLYTYALHEGKAEDGTDREYDSITLGGPGDEENCTVADSFAVFNVNVLVYGDIMLSFEHWPPDHDSAEPLFSYARHSSTLEAPEHVIHVSALEHSVGADRQLQFDPDFSISLTLEVVDVEQGQFSEEEIRMVDRVAKQLDEVESIAPVSRRAKKSRAQEEARRREEIETKVPDGDNPSLAIGLTKDYGDYLQHDPGPAGDMNAMLDALNADQIDSLLAKLKEQQVQGGQNGDAVAQLLANSGFTVDDDNELMIDEHVELDDDEDDGPVTVSMNDLVTVSDNDDPAASAQVVSSEDDDDDDDDDDGDDDDDDDDDDDADDEGESAVGGDERLVGKSPEEVERVIDDFIREALVRVAEEREVDISDPDASVSWLDLSGHVHGALLASTDRPLVSRYSQMYTKPVALSKKLRRLAKEMRRAVDPTALEAAAAEIALPPPAPLVPEMPAELTEALGDTVLLDAGPAMHIKRRVSQATKARAPEPVPAVGGSLLLRRGSQAANTTPEKKDLRPLHWNKIPDKVAEKTVYATAAPNVELFQDLMERTEEIDDLFMVQSNRKASMKEVQPTVKTAGVLTVKRQMNFDIMLSKFPEDLDRIVAAVKHLDPQHKVLNDEQVGALADTLIAKDELDLAKLYNGSDEELKELTRAEQFVIVASRLPGYNDKVRAANALRTYRTYTDDVRGGEKNLRRACQEVRASSSLRDFMQVVLLVGNTLNEGTNKGGAQGFRLSDLPKLADLRSKDRNLSLLHYTIQIAKQQSADATKFVDELQHLDSAMKLSKEELKGMISTAEKMLKHLGQQVEAVLGEGGASLESMSARAPKADDSDVQAAAVMYLTAQKECDAASTQANETIADFEDLAGFLGEKAARAKIEDVFGVLHRFCQLVSKCERDLAERAANGSSAK